MLLLESRMHKLTTEYQERVVELTAQIREVSEVEQKHYDTMQTEAMHRHEELLKLLSAQNSQAVPEEKANPVQNLKQEGPSSGGNRFGKKEFNEYKGKGILPMPIKEFTFKEEDRSEAVLGRSTQHQHTPYPRLEFPTFTGDEPRISKYTRFRINNG